MKFLLAVLFVSIALLFVAVIALHEENNQLRESNVELLQLIKTLASPMKPATNYEDNLPKNADAEDYQIYAKPFAEGYPSSQ